MIHTSSSPADSASFVQSPHARRPLHHSVGSIPTICSLAARLEERLAPASPRFSSQDFASCGTRHGGRAVTSTCSGGFSRRRLVRLRAAAGLGDWHCRRLSGARALTRSGITTEGKSHGSKRSRIISRRTGAWHARPLSHRVTWLGLRSPGRSRYWRHETIINIWRQRLAKAFDFAGHTSGFLSDRTLALRLRLNASMLVSGVGVAGLVEPDAFDGRVRRGNRKGDQGTQHAAEGAADEESRNDGEI